METLISEADYNQNRKSASKQDIAVLIKIHFKFKVDRLQIILVAKKYISTCRNCSLVGCLKCVQFHNCFHALDIGVTECLTILTRKN